MEDFNALASSLAQGVGDVRGCLILSRDGLVLGSHPAEAEGVTTPAWVRFAAIGDPERGFAQFGTETWCYVRRGPYAGFAAGGAGGAARSGDRPHGPGAARRRGGSLAARGAAGDRGVARGDGAPVQATVAPAPRSPDLRTPGDRGPGAARRPDRERRRAPAAAEPGIRAHRGPLRRRRGGPRTFARRLRPFPGAADARRPSRSPPPGPSSGRRTTSTSRTTRRRSRGRRR